MTSRRTLIAKLTEARIALRHVAVRLRKHANDNADAPGAA